MTDNGNREAAAWTLAAMLWDANNTTRLSEYPPEVQEPIVTSARTIIGMASYRPLAEIVNLAETLIDESRSS